ncbi:MAG: type 1 glutamine amidotransferase [Cellvibrionaceae bacterium]
MRIHYFQHVPFEDLAMIAIWAKNKGYSLTSTEFYKKDYVLPTVDDYDVLIIMGGPMSVSDKYSWLADEKNCIKAAIDSGKYVLGICLGAQLIAQVLGAEVKPNTHKEIGWHPIAFSDAIVGHPIISGLNYSMTVFHWHGECFSIPEGAINIASSAACTHQGFLHQDKVLGLQFHLEMDEAAVKKIVNACGDELVASDYIQNAETIIQSASQHHLQRTLNLLLDNWLEQHNG